MYRSALSALVMVGALCAAHGEDFNQWRGPHRSGVVPDSPPLAAAWGEDGPRLLWESEEIPAGGSGGYGSVAVASGRVFVFVNEKYKVPLTKRVLSERALRSLGWRDVKLPEHLAKAVEAARASAERQKLSREQRREWIEKWLEEHLEDEQQRAECGRLVSDRLERGDKALPLNVLEKLATVQDRQFASAEALEKWLTDNRIEGDDRKAVLRAVPADEGRSWDTVYCLRADDGRTLWKARHDGAPDGRSASSTPCVAEGRCYAAGSDGVIYCLDIEDGRELWKARPEGKGGTIHSSPMVAEGKVVVLAGRLTALDAERGTVVWRQEKVSGSDSSPVLWGGRGRSFVLCNGARGVACVRLADGEIVWEVPGGGRSTVAVGGDVMAVLTGKKKVGLLAYRIGPEKAEQILALPQCDEGAASPIVRDGHVYVPWRNAILCADVAGGKVAWERKFGGRGFSSPVLADGKVLAYGSKSLYVIEATPAEYRALTRASVPFCEHTSPAVNDGCLYVRQKKSVACYDLRPVAPAPP